MLTVIMKHLHFNVKKLHNSFLFGSGGGACRHKPCCPQGGSVSLSHSRAESVPTGVGLSGQLAAVKAASE